MQASWVYTVRSHQGAAGAWLKGWSMEQAVIEERFLARARAGDFPLPQSTTSFSGAGMDKATALSLFDSQIKSRLLDLIARELKEKNLSWYTIGSSGHEGNAVFGALLRPSDMAFLHYRSGAFFIERARRSQTVDGVRDVLLSLVASSRDPISGGRHKVFGSQALNIPPQTSTIASHLPKALGAAISIRRAKELKLASPLPEDAVIYCSFGDASANHASAQTTFNACAWAVRQSCPTPILFVCEDNGIGISVPTPTDWIAERFGNFPGLHYIACDGLNIADVWQKTEAALAIARTRRQPVFLHMRCVRLMGHAGSDIETQYRTPQEIAATEALDPLLYTAGLIKAEGWMQAGDILALYQQNRTLIEAKASEVVREPKLSNRAQIMASIVPKPLKGVRYPRPSDAKRQEVFGTGFTQLAKPRNLCQNINAALTDLMLQYPNMLMFGEDVGKKGGVYRVTADLQARFGQRRVFDTLLDETTILGTAIGFAHNGFIPVPEIQFLAYLHNAEDQLRGEASTLSFFSSGQFTNPMVIRIASLAYQKGFGGHFHNDNSIAVLRDLPGVLVACPSNGEDAAKMLRTCLHLAAIERRVVVFLEPIALYMTKDLHAPHDNGYLCVYPEPSARIEPFEVGVYGEGDTVILSYANGVYLSRQAQKILADEDKIRVKVVDLRWLAPLPEEAILREVARAKRVLIVDEGRRSGSLSEGLMTLLMEQGAGRIKIRRMTGEDCFIPLGTAWQHLLPSRDGIVEAVRELCSTSKEKERGRFAVSG
nr:alpha-ketoacid dehydrogenase subunit alpha/beta [Legionella geestiana]